MTENELQIYLQDRYPQENEACDWKEFKSLKHFFNGKEGDDVISYVAAISSMDGGHVSLWLIHIAAPPGLGMLS